MPGNLSCMPSAGAASASSSPTETTSVTRGWRSAGRSNAGHSRGGLGCPSRPTRAAVSRHSTGTRGRSTQRPSLASRAGRTVRDPSTATATTRIEPIASDENTTSPASSSPAIAIATATPETTTAWPLVSAAISTASRCERPFARSSRSRRT